MKRLVTTRWVLLALGMAIAFLVEGFVAPSRVQASCGDYLNMNPRSGQHSTPHSPTTSTPAPQQPETTPSESSQSTDIPFSPCPGPNCSRQQPPPLAPPAPVPTPKVQEQWACVLNLLLLGGPEQGESLVDDVVLRPVRRASSTYHPPRSPFRPVLCNRFATFL